MNPFPKKTALLFLTVLLLPPMAGAGTQMYRWVDSQGKVHYGDTLPPEYAKQGHAEMTKSGRVVKEAPPAVTPEQLKARQEAETRDRQAREKMEEQRRRDKALLASYTTVEELDLAERRNLEAVDLQIKSYELRIRSVEQRLASLKKQRDGFAGRNRPVPADLTQDIHRTQEEIRQLKDRISEATQEKEQIRARFAEDRRRFLELKGQARSP